MRFMTHAPPMDITSSRAAHRITNSISTTLIGAGPHQGTAATVLA